MDCRQQMQIKLEVMELLGFDKQVMELYCHFAPKQICKNIKALVKLKQIVIKYRNEEINQYEFLDLFFSAGTCPYCNTAKRYCATCNDCSYGKIYGLCCQPESNYYKIARTMHSITTEFTTNAAIILLDKTIDKYKRSKQK